jgi:hypothetical protein
MEIIPILIYKRTNKESRHCEEGKARRGNPQKWFFLKKRLKRKPYLVYGLLCRFAPRNDGFLLV